jgi:uncharacterized protein (DUF885 family)
MLRPLKAAIAAAALCACVGVPPAHDAGVSESDRLNAWFEQKYEEELRFSPLELTMLGRKELNDELDDFSLEARERQLRWQRDSVREMQRRFRHELLDEEAKLSWDLWKYRYDIAAAGRRWWLHAYPFEQMGGAQSELPTILIAFHSVDTEADLLAYVRRLEALPRVMDQLLARTREAARRGIRPPRFAQEGVIDQARKLITGAPFDGNGDCALWADLQQEIDGLVSKGAITPSRTVALKEVARVALLRDVEPAYRKLIAWFEQDMARAAVNPAGVGSSQPRGLAYYDYQLAESTTTSLTAVQIHRQGLAEVARLRTEMEALKAKVEFQGTLHEFFEFLDTDARFRFPDSDAGRQAYLDAATAAIGNIRRQLPRYFGLLPRAELVVKRVEAYREQPGAAQHYYPSTPDGARPGVYYAHLIDMAAMPKTELEVVAYHEGLPGHHMQVAIAQELPDLPLFRRQSSFNAYAEGWALYAEWLAREMPGTYTDPYAEFGRLTSEMFRAVRLVVDTGLHAQGWTEQRAVDYFLDNTPMPEAAVRSEVQRYLVWPGQATGYKIGMLRIQQLRRRAEAALGSGFDIRGFHDVVLGGGSLPLDLLERRIDRWIDAQKTGTPFALMMRPVFRPQPKDPA